MILRSGLVCGCSLAAMTLCSAATSAQTAAPQMAAQVVNRTEAAPVTGPVEPGAEAVSENPDIIVTATRRETSIERTPIAVSAFTQQQLDRQQVANVSDIQRFVPSLQFNQNAANNALLITLRGIGNDAAFTVSSDPEVGFYVDGIYAPTVQGSSGLLYDLERLEVLRGPQGTLFGRNTTAGAITLTTAKPNLNATSGYLELIGGDYGRFGSRGALNVPITNTLAVRLSFATEQHDGYVSYQNPPTIAGVNTLNFITSGKRYDSQQQQSGRISLLWQPNDRFKWNLDLEGFVDEGTPDIPILQVQRAGQPRYSLLADTPPQKLGYDFSIRSTMNYQLSDYLDLTYIAGYSRDHSTDQVDSDAGALPILTAKGRLQPYGSETITDRKDSSFISQEVQLKSTGHHFIEWIAGAFYSNEQATGRQDIDDRNGYSGGVDAFSISFIGSNYLVNSYAGYGQATANITPRFRLTGGLRYSIDDKSSTDGGTVSLDSGCPAVLPANAPSCNGIVGQYTNINNGAQLASLLGPEFEYDANNIIPRTFKKLTYLARAEYDVADNIMAYAGVSTGFKSGVINASTQITGPETLTDYEGGVKMRLLDKKLNLNFVGYYYDYKGFQVSEITVERDAEGNPVGSTLQTLNAQGAKAYGFEMEAAGQLTRHDRVQLAMAYQHTKLGSLITLDQRFDSDPNDVSAQRQLQGNQLPHAPHFSVTATLEHDFDLPNGGKITPRGTVHYESSSWLSIFNGDRTNRVINGVSVYYGSAFDKQTAYTRSDLALRYTSPGERYEAEIFVKNVENTAVRTNVQNYNTGSLASMGVFLSYLQAPRTFGGRMKYKF